MLAGLFPHESMCDRFNPQVKQCSTVIKTSLLKCESNDFFVYLVFTSCKKEHAIQAWSYKQKKQIKKEDMQKKWINKGQKFIHLLTWSCLGRESKEKVSQVKIPKKLRALTSSNDNKRGDLPWEEPTQLIQIMLMD